jgi:hypothetical protein
MVRWLLNINRVFSMRPKLFSSKIDPFQVGRVRVDTEG